MRVRIHRGAHEIGGNCVELEAQGARLVLDLGRPLDIPSGQTAPLPPVSGLETADDSLVGIVLSHAHQDHWGLLPQVGAHVPVYLGEAAHRILREGAFFGAGDYNVEAAGHLRDREAFSVGPFAVTPFLNDHSAFDAYSMLVEADGQRVFYTGDLRGHGRKAALFEKLLRRPPLNLDVVLMEGTHISPAAADRPAGPTEADVEQQLVAAFRTCSGPVLVAASAQNIDRMVSVYRAARASDRVLVVDLYAARIAAATGHPSIPKPGFPAYRVWVPQRQRVRVKASGDFERVKAVRSARLYPEQLGAVGPRAVFLFRSSLAHELEQVLDLHTARFIWSLWSGYLASPYDAELSPFLARHDLEPVLIHSSGHASVTDLERFVVALKPRQLVPIHTFGGDRYADLFSAHTAVAPHDDGVWWEVAP